MKNKFITMLIIFLQIILLFSVYSQEQFSFDVTEIEILENGNKIVGSKRGEISTNDGIIIEANNFTYIKNENILNAYGKVIIKDTVNNYNIYSNDITYEKSNEKISTKGKTKSEIYSRYIFNSSDVTFFRNKKTINSNKKTTIVDNDEQTYIELKNFNFSIENEILEGENILVSLNYNLPQNDKLFFENGIFNFKKESFVANNIQINLAKDLFDNLENDPRLKGVSAKSDNNITTVKEGSFTSCSDKSDCPPWMITSKVIKHDKNKKQLIYKDAVLKVYNVPVLYFPKFFHPDPTVDRQSGFLKPSFNNSNVLGSSINIPYYHVISQNQDFTFRPTLFDDDVKMFQNEYRIKNKNSSLFLDFSYIDNFKSALTNKKNSISHIFANFDADLAWKNLLKAIY